MLRLAWYTADSIRRFDSKTNRTADSIRDSIRTKKNDSQVPTHKLLIIQNSGTRLAHHYAVQMCCCKQMTNNMQNTLCNFELLLSALISRCNGDGEVNEVRLVTYTIAVNSDELLVLVLTPRWRQ